jgi:DNA-binding NarL/FixJ family response regulator
MITQVMLVEDHHIVRQGLRALLARENSFTVVAEAANGRAAIGEALHYRPDIVVMDLVMPELNGIDAARTIKRKLPRTKIVMLSAHSDKLHIEEAFKAGVDAYLLKECLWGDLAQLLVDVRNGGKQLLVGVPKGGTLPDEPTCENSVFTILTPREREVLQLLAEGNTTRQTAEKLRVSPKTIESHRLNLYDKLDAKNIADLTRVAIRQGLIATER